MNGFTRREWLETVGTLGLASAVLGPLAGQASGEVVGTAGQSMPLTAIAGADRITLLPGRTYLNAWAGYGKPPRREQPRPGQPAPRPSEPPGPPPSATWSKVSGPGSVTFADAASPVTSATFSAPGDYVLQLKVDNGHETTTSTLHVTVIPEPPHDRLQPVATTRYRIDSPFWGPRFKALIVNWIPHCIDQINRTDIKIGPGGIDNFVEAAKALAGQPHGNHKGYVFSNAWVHQTVEAMSLALMVDAQGDQDILHAQEKMRATLDDWIPKILAAQEPDGYLQTAFTLRNTQRWAERWSPQGRGNHEGYVAGYFIESAINHYTMTGGKDRRLYDGAKKLADCWCDNLGPAPKKPWHDGHQEMEQALARFGRFVNEVDGAGKGDRYIALSRFLLDSRKGGSEYDQTHLPVTHQYEAVGHAVRAVYQYSAMSDVVLESRDVDYQSAVLSLWDNIHNRKYYVTGGVGAEESFEGFGPDYLLPNAAYCEACSSCGLIFFDWKLHLAYRHAKYADLYEETIYNALLGALDLEGRNFYYDNPLDANVPRGEWHVCPCCVGNIPRTLLMMPTWTYTRGADSLHVNLFVGSTVTVPGLAGTDVEVVQATDYPWHGKVVITVNPKTAARFAVHVRVPNRQVSSLYRRTPQVDGLLSLSVNGTAVKPVIEHGYAVMARTWKKGDRIELELPLTVQRVRAHEKVEAARGKAALQYGPLVYNIEKADQEDIGKAIAAQASFAPAWRADLLGGVMTLTGRFSDGSRLLAVPNYARYNREPAPPPVPQPVAGAPKQPEPPPPPPRSVVWIKEV